MAASRQLSIPTSSVSRAIARLEKQLGVPLLRRTTRKVVLTEEGRQLRLRAGAHLESLHEALLVTCDRRPEPAGVVRVTAPAFTGATRVTRALARFALQYPRISMEIDPTNVVRDLLEDGFDFGIRVGPIVDADFVARRFHSARYSLLAAKSFVKNKLRGRPYVSREMLESGPCIVTRPTAVWRFKDGTAHPSARFTVNDPRATVDVARLGLGIVLAPADALGPEPTGLVPLDCELGEPEPVELFVVYPKQRILPVRVRLAIDWLLRPA